MKKRLFLFLLVLSPAIYTSLQAGDMPLKEIVSKMVEQEKGSMVDADSLPHRKEIAVAGRVVDESNDAIANATVIIKGSPNNRTASNSDGFYSIKAAIGDTIIFFSHQMQPEIKVVERSRINAKLKAGEISREDMLKLFGGNMRQNMRGQGRMNRGNAEADVNVSGDRPQREGFAGQREGRRQRGGTNADAQRQGGRQNAMPENILYIVDGREIADMSQISPEMIEEIALQKNETITATYGSRAVEGAMIIKTKNYDETKIAKGDTKLYYVDGTEVDETEATAIEKSRIEKKTELKGKNATAQYGSRARKGVILIITKKN